MSLTFMYSDTLRYSVGRWDRSRTEKTNSGCTPVFPFLLDKPSRNGMNCLMAEEQHLFVAFTYKLCKQPTGMSWTENVWSKATDPNLAQE